ncbi:MAG: type II toxin-antitoxin system RelE/ParE family toxin [Limnospira sp. PMC 1291.21]|uniref:Plasmid stabilization system protein n=3 Tax=Limnospira TaxID=2596745 RepID=A0A9P1KCL5_9CYAN|nr:MULTISPECIES: type II toxin-antitoxin system RelE/ParE family toxin [Limnospira]EKD10843.1 plasmid stabilization system [Arthrospira platensis C1]MDC0837051.1 type II toxin-antitoxin system RelE/ParE family toxin [Limnoraphis robusta]MDY7051009.1 type II toxin-antitoxin system RelE/ParE family toxin [Limnospira fusiformis LS22]QJB27905.1 type II toxin-antitoxin system RelE/ParE family toxin [Limnospira fusiformis SAG 85.79]RAQ43360.1 type II toxin-antitoxin system RelE/ParE family toxin [Ar
MGTYSFSDAALADLETISVSLSEINPDLAIRFFEKVRDKCRQFAQFPNMGKNYSHIKTNLRGLIVENHIIFYFPRPDGIDIVRIINGYRDLESLNI